MPHIASLLPCSLPTAAPFCPTPHKTASVVPHIASPCMASGCPVASSCILQPHFVNCGCRALRSSPPFAHHPLSHTSRHCCPALCSLPPHSAPCSTTLHTMCHTAHHPVSRQAALSLPPASCGPIWYTEGAGRCGQATPLRTLHPLCRTLRHCCPMPCKCRRRARIVCCARLCLLLPGHCCPIRLLPEQGAEALCSLLPFLCACAAGAGR